jgi:hypothetical protein
MARLVIFGGLVGAAPVVSATTPPAAAATAGGRERGVDPRADAALKQMSGYVAGLRSFRVDTTTIDEKVTTQGQKIQEVKESRVAVQRPSAMAIDRTGPAGRVLFRYDGKALAVYGVDRNVYASAPAPSTIDQTIDVARDRYGLDAPGGDLIASDSYHALLDGVTVGRYVGLEPIGDVMTHHLVMSKGAVDYQLWIQAGPQPVPLRYVITSRDMPGQPQFTLELHNWQPEVPLSDASFTFMPPPNAQKVALGTLRSQQPTRGGTP